MENFKDRIKIAPKDKYKVDNKPIKAFPYYKMYDENGNFVGQINPEKEKMQHKWLRGVTCFLVNKKAEVLMERRTSKGITPGKIDLVSGHCNEEEESSKTMQRELSEEIGISVENDRIKHLGRLPLVFGGKRKFFIDFFFCQYNGEKLNVDPNEVESVSWVPIEQVLEMIENGQTKFPSGNMYKQIFENLKNEMQKQNERSNGEEK